MAVPKITDVDFGRMESAMCYQIAHIFAEYTKEELPDGAKERVAKFVNDLIEDETEEA